MNQKTTAMIITLGLEYQSVTRKLLSDIHPMLRRNLEKRALDIFNKYYNLWFISNRELLEREFEEIHGQTEQFENWAKDKCMEGLL